MRRINAWRQTISDLRATYAQMQGQMPSLFRPRSFTEKMQWRKLFDRNPAFKVFCDKLATRDWITARIGAKYLAPLHWSGNTNEIPFDTLVPPYFLKSSHASGQVISVPADAVPERTMLMASAAAWLQICYFEQNGEPGYKNIPRYLMVEQTLFAEDGGPPEECRMFVFDGKVAIINTVFVEEGKVRNGAFHTRGWERLDWHFTRVLNRDFPPPRRLDEMIRIAELLGKGLDHIRVDIYDCGDSIFISELTPYSWGGFVQFNPAEADLALGRYWRLKWPLLRAVAAVLFGAPITKETAPSWDEGAAHGTGSRRMNPL